MNPNALVEIRSPRVILLNPNACQTRVQPHSALTGPTRLFQSNLIESQCMSNPSPAPLSPNRPYSALLGPTRPEPAPRARCMPNPTQPYLLGPGPDRPHAAPLGLSLSPGSQRLVTQCMPNPTHPPNRLLGPTPGFTRPHLAYPCSQGLVLEKSNACPLSCPTRPHSARTGHAAPLGLSL